MKSSAGEIEKVRDSNGEFFVTVIGSNGDKDFKVKRKHFASLFADFNGNGRAKLQSFVPTAQTPKKNADANTSTNNKNGDLESSAQVTHGAGQQLPSAISGNSFPGSSAPKTAEAKISRPARAEARNKGCIGISYEGNPRIPHDGIPVSSVLANGPAADAGLHAGDFVTAINDHYVTTADELASKLLRHPAGSQVTVRYRHGSTIFDMSLTLSTCGSGL